MHSPTRDPERWHGPIKALAVAAAGDDGAHDASHLDRVWRHAQGLLAFHPEADRLVVLAACYLHDLVNLPKDDAARALASRCSASPWPASAWPAAA
ncbi:MAG: uncharacterized protein V7631_506 [Massilia sp.]|jgi:uncharacterized protein